MTDTANTKSFPRRAAGAVGRGLARGVGGVAAAALIVAAIPIVVAAGVTGSILGAVSDPDCKRLSVDILIDVDGKKVPVTVRFDYHAEVADEGESIKLLEIDVAGSPAAAWIGNIIEQGIDEGGHIHDAIWAAVDAHKNAGA